MGSVGAFAPLGASVFGCDASYAQLCAFPVVAGSFQTRCWREMDSNHRSPVSGEAPVRLVIGSPAATFRENSACASRQRLRPLRGNHFEFDRER
jgi:hypothetical protein